LQAQLAELQRTDMELKESKDKEVQLMEELRKATEDLLEKN